MWYAGKKIKIDSAVINKELDRISENAVKEKSSKG